MPTKEGKTYANTYKNDLVISQASNTGIDSTTRRIQSGNGVDTAIQLSDDVLSVAPVNDDVGKTFGVTNVAGASVFAVDTANKTVHCGENLVNSLTLIKEMGLYDFSPSTAGYHFPLIAHTMFVPTGATAFAADEDWGNATDPPTTLDVSGLTNVNQAIACYWYLENNITLDLVRFHAVGAGSVTLNFHLFAYDLDTSSNHGDLSGGVVHANATLSATTSPKIGTFTLDTANIDAGKVVIGFVENVTDTSDVSCAFTIKYHIR